MTPQQPCSPVRAKSKSQWLQSSNHTCTGASSPVCQARGIESDVRPRRSSLQRQKQHCRSAHTAAAVEAAEDTAAPRQSLRQRTGDAAVEAFVAAREAFVAARQAIHRQEDCGVCNMCLDKPKFGGPNIKKQACQLKLRQLKALKDGKPITQPIAPTAVPAESCNIESFEVTGAGAQKVNGTYVKGKGTKDNVAYYQNAENGMILFRYSFSKKRYWYLKEGAT